MLVETVAGVQRVVAACAVAEAAGVRGGMPLTDARALVTDRPLEALPHEPEADARALRALAAWAHRYSPVVVLDPPNGLLIDVAGCEHLFHGERRLANLVANELAWLGVHARVAIASTWGCAWAMARYGSAPRTVVAPGDERAALAALPVAALRLEPDSTEGLREVGIDTVRELLALPRLELAARFDADLRLRIDQCLGEAIETIEPLRPVEPIEAEQLFQGPTTRVEAIALTVRRLLADVTDELARRERGACEVELTADRADAPPVRTAIVLSRPSRDPKHLGTLLAPKVERLDLGFGVERLHLAVRRDARLAHRQSARWRGDADGAPLDRALGEFVDTVRARLGDESVRTARPVASHRPERAFRWSAAGTERRARATPVTAHDRPSTLFAAPEPADVIALTPDGPPSWLRWRGAERTLVSAAGPERLADEWWRRDRDGTRDYFRVQDDAGRWLWIFRAIASGRWFVHGEWA